VADNQVTLVGNITDDPELRFTPSGSAVANFTVAINRRIRQGDRWEDRLDGFFNCSCWRDLAENAAESLRKGTRVVVVGRLQQRSWEDREGNRRTAVEVQVDEVAPSLRWATASVQKSQRSSGGAPRQSGGGGAGAGEGGGGGADDWSAPANVPSGPPGEGSEGKF
jgi:single-strand DNA-binding protein